MALYSAGKPGYEKQLKDALEYLINHLSTKTDTEIQRFFTMGIALFTNF